MIMLYFANDYSIIFSASSFMDEEIQGVIFSSYLCIFDVAKQNSIFVAQAFC